MKWDTTYPGTKLWEQILDSNKGYTQREWDRIVGYGKVPDKYKRKDDNGKKEE